jgi:hypothetical protein
VFFFEKKNQKTFDRLSRGRRQRTQRSKSFLVLFFKKEHFLLAIPPVEGGTRVRTPYTRCRGMRCA